MPDPEPRRCHTHPPNARSCVAAVQESPSSVSRAVALALLAFSLGGCAADASSADPQPPEELSPFEWNPILATADDGPYLYVARATRLDRVDTRTGEVARVAGPEYAACPHAPSTRWAAMISDFGYPSFAARDGVVFLSETDCGLWSFRVADGVKASLIKAPPYASSSPAIWGNGEGPRWSTPWPIPFTLEPDGFSVCFSTFAPATALDGASNAVEVWHAGLDGSAPRRLAVARQDRIAGGNFCSQITSDATTVYFTAGRSLYAVEKQSEGPIIDGLDPLRLRVLVGLTSPFPSGLAVAEDGVVYEDDGAINRIGKNRLRQEVLVAPQKSTEPTRFLVRARDGWVYFGDGTTVRRVPLRGGVPQTVVAGDRSGGSWPAGFLPTADHIYFPRFRQVPAHSVTDPETGTVRDDVTLEFSIARARLPEGSP